MAAVNVQNRVAKAQGFLPAEVTQVGVITSKRQTSMLLGFTVYSTDDRFDQTFLQNYMKINLIPQIQRVPGVGDVMAFGADYSMRIWLKPDVMAQYKLMPSDITAALAEQKHRGRSPDNWGKWRSIIPIYHEIQRTSPDDRGIRGYNHPGHFRRGNPTIERRCPHRTGWIKLRLFEQCERSPRSHQYDLPDSGFQCHANHQRHRSIVGRCFQRLPPGVEYSILLSANDFLYASIHEVLKTLIEAFILVFLVVFIFLQDFRSTLIPRHSDSGCFDRYVLCALPDRVQHELANTLRPRAGYRNRGR